MKLILINYIKGKIPGFDGLEYKYYFLIIDIII
jgi:hypothetical protein